MPNNQLYIYINEYIYMNINEMYLFTIHNFMPQRIKLQRKSQKVIHYTKRRMQNSDYSKAEKHRSLCRL
jgi:hypothetical protein